jgi:hypothetical protein
MSDAIVTWQASGTIGNPDVYFPPSRCVHTVSEIGDCPKPITPTVAELAKISFPDLGLGLLFEDDKMTCYLHAADHSTGNLYSLAETLRPFIMFKTLMLYNVFCPPRRNDPDRWDATPECDRVSFNLCRAVKKPYEDDRLKGWYPGFEAHCTVLNREDVERYLHLVNYDVALAIHYYLRGCDNREYCLVEWYKALEVVQGYFGGEKKMTERLSSYGFVISEFKKLTRYANDELKPLSIGRHAPRKGSSLIHLDMRRLEQPMAEQIFRDAWSICRRVIQVFIESLSDDAAGE